MTVVRMFVSLMVGVMAIRIGALLPLSPSNIPLSVANDSIANANVGV